MNYRIFFIKGGYTEIIAFCWSDIVIKYSLSEIKSIELIS